MRITKATAGERLFQCVFILGSVFFLVTGVLYLCFGAWPITHQDFWRIYRLCMTSSWAEVAIPKYNNHSGFFPSIFWIVDLRYLHRKEEPLFIVGLILQLLGVALLLFVIGRDRVSTWTEKLAAASMVALSFLWMGRASITASGGFNCVGSLTLDAALVSFVFLPKARDGSMSPGLAVAIVIAGCYVATFSFGTGLAAWPAVLLVAWGLRLPRRSILLLVGAALVCAIIFGLLPSGADENVLLDTSPPAQVFTLVSPFAWLFQVVGSPGALTIAAWCSLFTGRNIPSSLTLSCGIGLLGVALAVALTSRAIISRHLSAARLDSLGTTLIYFALAIALLIVIGRTDHILVYPEETLAPRYLFWSTLFWLGLFMVLLHAAPSIPALRWPTFTCIFLTLLAAIPSHEQEGMRFHYARCWATEAATALINNVQDAKAVSILSNKPPLVYYVAQRFRARRLDMFASGLQDWIGKKEAALFHGKMEKRGLHGVVRIEGVLKEDGQAVAKISGQAVEYHSRSPQVLVVVDPEGNVRGIARSCSTPSWMNRLLYSNRFPPTSFGGYIRNYQRGLSYHIRSADEHTLSREAIILRPSS